MTTPPMQKIPVSIEHEMKNAYLEYAMSVIIARALPDVRDGLKPVHRRVLFAMYEQKNFYNQAYKKSARIVGDVIGKYHPHGDSAVYDTIVRLVQPFSMRYPLVQGQGNFGSIDGDSAAAMRYTEVRLQRIAGTLLNDLEKDTVEWGPNYDNSLKEPLLLPARIPNLLINGASGIAVGMATNIPPHNLAEVVDATIHLIHNPNCDISDLMTHVKGPDFPTGGFIYGREGIEEAYRTGRSIIRLRARAMVERNRRNDRESIVVTEIPYMLNKARLIEKIAEVIKTKKIEGISDLRDESDRDGMRIVMELKRDAVAGVVMNQLYALTPMSSSFGIIMLSLVRGQPKVLDLKQMLQYFVDHRRDVVTRRTRFELAKAKERAHILEGLKIALDNIDEVVQTIRRSASPNEARDNLMVRFGLSERQSQAILDMRLQRLTGLEREKIEQELREVLAEIARLEGILASDQVLMDLIVEELKEVRESFGDARRTEIVAETREITVEDLIVEEDMVVTVSHTGYIKRNAVSLYRAQRRGGRGRKGMSTKEDDLVTDLFVASTHDTVLVFSDRGQCYSLKVYDIPQASRASRGKAIVNLLDMEKGEEVAELVPVRQFDDKHYLVFVTKRGIIKKTTLSLFANARARGIYALNVDEDDQLISVRMTSGNDEILLATARGYSIRFKESDVRSMGRTARGVKGMALRPDDRVIGMVVPREGASIFTMAENGYGKRTNLDEYRLQSRGGLGIITMKTSERNGAVVGISQVTDDDEVMLITSAGVIIRFKVSTMRIIGRVTQGVRLISLEEGVTLTSMARLAEQEEGSDADMALDGLVDYRVVDEGLVLGPEDGEDFDGVQDEDSPQEPGGDEPGDRDDESGE